MTARRRRHRRARRVLLAAVLSLTVVVPAQARVNRWKVIDPLNAKLERMAMCESGGRWWIWTPPFSGGLQFLPSTWRSVGGRGMPHENTRIEQKYRAALLIRREGFRPWPVCGTR